MATPQVGQMYKPSGAAEITQDFLDDLYLAAQANGNPAPPTQPGTDWNALGVAIGNALLIQYANLQIAEDNGDILTAQGPALEEKRIAYGLLEVKPSPSTGKIRVRVNGAASVPDGRQLTLPSGLRLQVSGTQAVIDKSEIDVIAIDTGTATNAKGGTKVQFISPPLNVLAEAEVSKIFPLVGGIDTEGNPAKRQRILDRLRYQPGGGNWAGLRDIAKTSLASLQDCFVYPALGGPSSAKSVLVKAYDTDNLDFSRAPNVAQVSYVRAAIQAANASQNEQVVQAVADQPCDVALQLTIPDSSLSGGNGSGWSDSAPWPPLLVGDGGRVRLILNPTSPVNIRVGAQTSVSPIPGQTRIAWWSKVDRRFYIFTIVGLPGSATSGSWDLQLDRPMADSSGSAPVNGDFVSPAAEHILDYGSKWVELMGNLGPGENTADTARLPRALRHPYLSAVPDSSLSFVMLRQMSDAFSEITSLSYTSATSPTSPSVPATVDLPPNILQLQRFAIYKV